MKKGLIGEISYANHRHYRFLMDLLQKTANDTDLESYFQFEVEFQKMISERDSFSDEEIKTISDVLMDKEYPKEISTGAYLDQLKGLIFGTNEVLRKAVPESEEVIQYGLVDDDILDSLDEIFCKGYRAFGEYMGKLAIGYNQRDRKRELHSDAERFLRVAEDIYERFLG